MSDSLWQLTTPLPEFPPLSHDEKTDILIVGGGMAGLLCAYLLKQAGADCLLIEANTLAGRTTGKTTAKITAGHGAVYHKLLRRFGTEKARLYLKANMAAVEQYRQLCSQLDCDFEDKDNYVYAKDDPATLMKELSALRRLGAPVEFDPPPGLPFSTVGAIRFPRQAQFQPLKFIREIVSDLPIYEHTELQELVGTTVLTNHGKIRANRVIIATHFPLLNKHGSYFLKMYQERSYVIALEDVPPLDGMYIDEKKGGLSLRSFGRTLLVGGGNHRTGKKGAGWRPLREFARKTYPEAREVAHWATQDCMTLDDVPYIGPYSAGTRGLYVATGFNKWGMTSSMVAATLLCDMMQGKSNPYAALFSPSRTILRPQLAVNAFEETIGLLSLSKQRCPHLGCALTWNPREHSWDCPCHGSRFSREGKLLDNPATGDLKKL